MRETTRTRRAIHHQAVQELMVNFLGANESLPSM
jgi:hypothetical protein